MIALMQPLKTKRPQRQPISNIHNITAPWRGLNTRDRLEELSTEYASILDNLIPENGEIELRYGYSSHATGLPASVETLMQFTAAGSSKLFAASGTGIYDVTTAGAVGAADVSSLTNARFIHTMYSATSGDYLVVCNGADSVRNYNGSTWSTPTITGVTSANLIYVTDHKGRLWFIEANSFSLWYLATNAISGAATEFPVGSQLKRGGTLVAASSWSRDAGDGQDDLFVIASTEGEILVYAGTNPASDYVLVGRFETARPIGARCLQKHGAELIIQTTEGPVACSELMTETDIEKMDFAELVRSDFKAEALSLSGTFGWQTHLYTKRGWLMFNVPTTFGGETFRQYCLNENAWFRLREMPAVCWGELSGELYFGAADGVVYLADDPSADGDNGDEIIGRCLWAWSRLGYAGEKKAMMARPHMFADAQPNIYLQMMTNYEVKQPTAQPTVSDQTTGVAWDSDDAIWDEAPWAGTIGNYSSWVGLEGIGTVMALYAWIETKTLDEFRLNAVDIAYEAGGF